MRILQHDEVHYIALAVEKMRPECSIGIITSFESSVSLVYTL